MGVPSICMVFTLHTYSSDSLFKYRLILLTFTLSTCGCTGFVQVHRLYLDSEIINFGKAPEASLFSWVPLKCHLCQYLVLAGNDKKNTIFGRVWGGKEAQTSFPTGYKGVLYQHFNSDVLYIYKYIFPGDFKLVQ